MADEPGAGAGLQGSFVMQKTGPLPNWAWMALGLGAALGYAAWKNSKKKAADAAAGNTTSPNGVNSKATGSANGITYAFVDADSTVNTQYAYPPGGGRPPRPRPGPPPDDTDAPNGQWVTVTKWTKHNAPWSSTLYGIADHIQGTGDSWQSIWNAPQNKRLQELRGDPEEIQPGDKVWVPGAAPGTGQDMPSGHPTWPKYADHDRRNDDQDDDRGAHAGRSSGPDRGGSSAGHQTRGTRKRGHS